MDFSYLINLFYFAIIASECLCIFFLSFFIFFPSMKCFFDSRNECMSYFHIRWKSAVEKPMNILYMCAQLIGSPWNYDGHYKLASDQIHHHYRG